MNKHTVTTENGTFTRNSKTRVYTHAVAMVQTQAQLDSERIEAERKMYAALDRGNTSHAESYSKDADLASTQVPGITGIIGWCSRLDLAEKSARLDAKRFPNATLKVVPVDPA